MHVFTLKGFNSIAQGKRSAALGIGVIGIA
jgi:hypothetical protein